MVSESESESEGERGRGVREGEGEGWRVMEREWEEIERARKSREAGGASTRTTETGPKLYP